MSKVEEPDMSLEYNAKDYQKWTFEGLYELIKGKVWKMAPAPSTSHQKLSFELASEFSKVFRKQKCQAFFAPFDVYLSNKSGDNDEIKTIVQPDLCIVCDSSKIKEKGCFGAPDLVVEIISPSTAKKDLNDKFNVYQEFGVKEYWVVFPKANTINVYVLENGLYTQWAIYTLEDHLQSKVFEQLHFDMKEVFDFEIG